MNLARYLLAVAFMGAATAGAQTPTPATAPDAVPAPAPAVAPATVAPKDYSAGFAKLREYGLPDLSKAKYVQLSAWGGLDLGTPHYRVPMAQGNAWLLEHRADGSARFFDLDTMTFCEVQRESPNASDKTPPGKKVGAWAPVDATADAQALIESLRKTTASGEGREQFAERPREGVLVRAAAFSSAGLQREGNEIAGLALGQWEDPGACIRCAVSALVDGQYSAIVEKFAASRDWKAYRDELKALLDARGTVWLKRRQADHLLTALAAQVAGATPLLPAEGFSSRQREATAQFLATPPGGQRRLPHCDEVWLLVPPCGLLEDEDGVALLRFLALRNKILPVLIQWLGDQTLTPWFPGENSSITSARSEQARIDLVDAPTEAPEEYASMMLLSADWPLTRPISRAEIARALLSCVITTESFGAHPGRPDDADMARTFFAEIRGLDARQLAWYYFDTGIGGQPRSAIEFLLRAPQPGDYERMEKAMLASEQAFLDRYAAAHVYVAKRGKDAGPFLDKLARLLGADDAAPSQTENQRIEKEHWRAVVDRLRASAQVAAIVQSFSFEEALRKLPAGPREGSGRWGRFEPLSILAQAKPSSEIMKPVLTAAVAAKTAPDCWNLLEFLLHTLRPSEAMDLADPEPGPHTWDQVLAEADKGVAARAEETRAGLARRLAERTLKPEEMRRLIRACAPQWRQLLARTEPQYREYHATWEPLGDGNLGDSAAEVLATLTGFWDAPDAEAAYRALIELPDEGRRWMRAAAASILGDAPAELPPRPSPARVSAEQVQALLKRLQAATGTALGAILDTLGDDERLALAAALDLPENKVLNLRVLAECARVREAVCEIKDPALEKIVAAWKGQALSRKLADEMLACVKAQAAAGKATQCAYWVRPGFGGAAIRLARSPDSAASGLHDDCGEHYPPGVYGWLALSGHGAKTFWESEKRVAPKAARVPDDPDLEREETDDVYTSFSGESPDRFWAEVAEAVKAPEGGGRAELAFTGAVTAGPGEALSPK